MPPSGIIQEIIDALLAELPVLSADFQLPITLTFNSIIAFHDNIMFFGIFISIFVVYFLGVCVQRYLASVYRQGYIWDDIYFMSYPYRDNKDDQEYFLRLTHHAGLEIVWTLLPTILLCNIMVSSFAILYSIEELYSPAISVKVVGHQWYWTYEFVQKLEVLGIPENNDQNEMAKSFSEFCETFVD